MRPKRLNGQAPSTSFLRFEIISSGLVELVGPSMDDGMTIEFVHADHDAILELLFGFDTDVALHDRR